MIGHLKITPESSLKEMKEACKFLFLSKHGSKEILWKRLKKECAVGKMKVAVQISEDVRKEFEREPIPESLPALPDQETIEKHELTHLPRAPWCEECQAAKSREDNFEEGEQTIRNLAKTLLATVEQRSGCKVGSDVPLYSWAFRRAAWLHNRFHVGRDGRTAFEVVVDRRYKGKLAPFASAVVAKALPKVQEKGEIWEKGIFLGKDYGSNLNLIGTERGVIKARIMRRLANAYQPELLNSTVGAPWDHQLKTITSKRKKRVQPMEAIEDVPQVPAVAEPKRRIEGGEGSRPGDDKPGSDGPPPSGGQGSSGSSSKTSSSSSKMEADDESDKSEDEDPGETRNPPKKRQGDPIEELASRPEDVTQEGVQREPLKREAAGSLDVESPKKGPRIDEGTTEVVEPKGKVPRLAEGGNINRVLLNIRKFERVEEIEEHGDEDLNLETTQFYLEESAMFQEKWSEHLEEVNEDVLTTSWSNKYEDGPPKLDDEDLMKVDVQAEKVEEERLLKMGVLVNVELDEHGQPKENEQGIKPKMLSTKFVKDWRHRDFQWKRRARLVAREYRWLTDYDLAALYSPTSIASSVKLLSSLCVSSPDYQMVSIDISDAYLQVPQKEYTVVSFGGKWYQLAYTLPGQRTGSRDWFDFLKEILVEEGMESDVGLPSLFYKHPERNGEGGVLMSTHVDDLEVFGKEKQTNDVVELLKRHKLKIKYEGPVSVGEGKCTFLKRTFEGIPNGIEIRMDGKYVEKLEEMLGLGKACGKKIPFPMDYGRSSENDEPLNAEEHHLYRSCVGVLLYMSPERPDLGFATKWLSGKLAAPTKGDMTVLRHVAKYAKTTSQYVIEHETSYPGKSFLKKGTDNPDEERHNNVFNRESLIEVVTDADWATDRTTRQSTSCALIFVNGNLVYFHARKQKAIALSSCESELVAAVGGLSEGVFLQNLLERVLLLKPKMVIHMDSSSARAVLSKKGLGRTRHIQAGLLWVQRLPLETGLLIKAIAGKENPADVGTKALSRNQVVKCLEKIGVRTGEDVRSITNSGFISQKNLRRLIMVLMTHLGESSMTPEGEEKENGKALVSFHVLVFMILFSMIAVFVCAWTWMRLRSEGCLIVCRSADVFSSNGELKEVKEVKKYMPGPKASSPASVSGGDEMEKRVEELTKMREEARASREEVATRVAKRKRESEKEEKAPSESSDEEGGKSSPDEQDKQSSKEDDEVESEEEDEGKEMESVRKALQDLEDVEKEVNEVSDEREKLNELQ